GERIVKHAVDGKVAPQSIFAGRREHHVVRSTAIRIAAIGAKGCNLNFQVFFVLAWAEHFDHAETRAFCDSPAEESLDLVRNGVGGNVIVLGRQAEQLVAYAAACPERLMSRILELFDDRNGEFTFSHVQKSEV